MGQVIKINQRQRFSLDEARGILPVVAKITERAVDEFSHLEEKLNLFQHDPQKWHKVEEEIGVLLNRWSEKVSKLGCIPKGIWLVDFDNGEGYYCWRYGDHSNLYFHGYQEGFAGRIPIN